jgi:hypothetical protein
MEVNPMRTKLRMQETIENAFIAGLLLTGSVEGAENAILESVRVSCPDDMYGETLFRRALHHSIDQQMDTAGRQNELDRAKAILPFELRCVMNLSKRLRYCYVLRILVGLPKEVCAWLLHLTISQIDEHTCAAMLALPLIQQEEPRDAEGHTERKIIRKHPGLVFNSRRSFRSKTTNQRMHVPVYTSAKVIQFDRDARNF